MPTTLSLRVPALVCEWLEGSDAGIAAYREDRADDEHHAPDRLSAYRHIFATPARKDGSRHVAGLTADEVDVLLEDATWFEELAGQGEGWPHNLPELNAARAMVRGLRKLQPAWARSGPGEQIAEAVAPLVFTRSTQKS